MFRWIFEGLAGFLSSIILSSMMITIGYMTVHAKDLEKYTVSLFGLDIFTITEYGEKGMPVHANLKILGIVCPIVVMGCLELIFKLKGKKKANKT